jgi:hypothetical protein
MDPKDIQSIQSEWGSSICRAEYHGITFSA